MAEHDAPESVPSHGPSQQGSTAGLSRKLAEAYTALPPDQRTARHRSEDENISNPELERAFSEMLQSYQPASPEEREREAALLKRQIEQRLEEIAADGSPGAAEPDNGHAPGPLYGEAQDSDEFEGDPGKSPSEPIAAEVYLPVEVGTVPEARAPVHAIPAKPVEVVSALELKTPDTPVVASRAQDNELAATVRAVLEATLRNEVAARRTSALGWKAACLALLCLVLGMVVGQQQLWRQSLLMSYRSSPMLPNSAPAAVPTPSQPPTAVTPARPMPAEHPRAAIHTPYVSAKLPKKASGSVSSSAAGRVLPTASPLRVPRAAAPREVPETAPLTSSLPAPNDLPTIIKPPSAPPALGSVRAPAPPHEPASPSRVSQVATGALVYKVTPLYPQAARNARIQGSVVMHAIIGIDGTIQQLRVISGNPLLVASAMEAVRKWRYRPYLLDGKPVEVETNITVNFQGK
jgi:TonB family protein